MKVVRMWAVYEVLVEVPGENLTDLEAIRAAKKKANLPYTLTDTGVVYANFLNFEYLDVGTVSYQDRDGRLPSHEFYNTDTQGDCKVETLGGDNE